MSRFKQDLHYIKFGRGAPPYYPQSYPQPQVKKENIFDLIYRSEFNAVKAQITKGITNVHSKNEKGQTLLHYALLYNQIEIAEFLITQGADLNDEDNNGQKVKDLIEERCPNIYDNINILASSTPITSEQHLVEDTQVKESGNVNDCWCIIL